jgi:hypothetical protein
MAAAARQLEKVLTTPAKIASKFDWKKATASTILSLDIRKDQIGMAVASHPSFDPSARPLDTISLSNNRCNIDESAKNQLFQVVKENKVCGFVVSWPVQADSGRSGAACGRVLFTLEQILSGSHGDDSSSLASFKDSPVSPGRPMCLWAAADEEKIPFLAREDTWGRSAVYSRTCDADMHIASKHQYNQVMKTSPVSIWEDFVHVNWPTQARKTAAPSSKSSSSRSLVTPRRQRMSSSTVQWSQED